MPFRPSLLAAASASTAYAPEEPREAGAVRRGAALPFVVEVLAGHEPTAPCHRADELDALGALHLTGGCRRIPITGDRLPRVEGAPDRERMWGVVSVHAIEDIAMDTAETGFERHERRSWSPKHGS
jgi:hypothetical protein